MDRLDEQNHSRGSPNSHVIHQFYSYHYVILIDIIHGNFRWLALVWRSQTPSRNGWGLVPYAYSIRAAGM